MTDSRALVSVVVPALNEAPNIAGLLDRMEALANAHPRYAFELVLVDDGSTDATAELALALDTVPVRVVQLARNFGSHAAISAGIRYAEGSAAIVLGADAQEPLTLVNGMISAWEGGADVVWGVRETRSTGSWSSELASRTFSRLFTRYARLENYPAEGPSGVLVDRAVMDDLNSLEERNRNVLALIAWLGYRQETVRYAQSPRAHGSSKWTTPAMIKLAIDSLIQFSHMPLRLCTFVGLFTALAGMVYAAVLVARALSGVDTPSGWPTLLVAVLVLSGIQLVVIGVMGEYLWRAVEEVRRRPLYVVRSVRSQQREGVALR